MGLEFELKYRATPALLSQLRQDLPGQEAVLQMQTTYYDTPTGQFSARRCTLRRRLENQTYICTLKTPADGGGRKDWEVESDSIESAIDMLCKLDAPAEILALSEEGLIPICGARFRRITKTLQREDCVLEIALDEGVLTGGSRELPLCELEVELKSGSTAACIAYGKFLEQHYGLCAEENSKFCRALALYEGEI